MKEQMRAEFEAWLEKFSSAELTKGDDGDYIDWQVQISWCGFKAAWQHQQAKIDSLKAALTAVPAQEPELAKYQSCGCVICTCEHETQCQGCGAKNCGNHAVGNIPNPVFKVQQPAQEPLPQKVMWAFENIRNNYEAWRDNPNFKVLEQYLLKHGEFSPQQPAQEPTNKVLESLGNSPEGFHASQEQAKLKHHPICDGRYPSLCDACNAEAQEPAGIVEQWATPANLPAYVTVKWNGKPPIHGTKVYVMPPVEVKQENKCDDGAACGVGGYCITCPNVPPVEVKE